MPNPTVWIPAGTPSEHRSRLPAEIELRETPQRGPIADAPQPADILIAEFSERRALEVIPQLSGLRVVQMLSAGVDLIASRMPPGVVLCDGAGIHDASVSEWVVMATTAVRRHLAVSLRSQEQRTWRRTEPGEDLDGAAVLIVGYGSIGRAVEARLLPFGVRVTRVARRAREGVHGVDELPGLLPRADVVVLLTPLTDTTRRMVDAAFLAAMHDGALLVNAARGQIVDTGALLRELGRGRLRAALDVTDPEPLPDGHPLWSAPGVLITPHQGGAVRQLGSRAWRFAGEQVRRYIAGEPLRNIVSNGY
jgi:phosphoglycerate dehydrogenase-like enzyme